MQLAWVESPLQLLCAAEFAAAQKRPVRVAFRLSGPQMPTTAKELLDRGALFERCEPYYGIPWELLAAHRDWVIGDPFSGQFRTAMSTLGARSIAIVDDGADTLHAARALIGSVDYSRPGQHESTLKTLLGGTSRGRMLRLATRGRAHVFTAFADDAAVSGLRRKGFDVTPNTFAWTRATSHGNPLPHDRVVLGSARVADSTLTQADYLDWVRSLAAERPVSYLPHRRESAELIDAVATLPGLTVVQPGLPAELVLAGSDEPLEIITLGSSAATTLRAVLAGTGSSIRTAPIAPATPIAQPIANPSDAPTAGPRR